MEGQDSEVRMRKTITLFAVAFTCLSFGQVKQTLFSPEDRDQIMTFWNAPGRYVAAPPADAQTVGVWQVRLTVAGSQWLWNYNKVRKAIAPPTSDPKPVGDEQKEWETWLTAKISRDRWEAWTVARDSNFRLFGSDMPKPDKTIPLNEPPQPGPIPAGLLALAGDPPKFASAVVPTEYTVKFDDVTLTYKDNTKLSSPRYAFYRYSEGVASEGVAIKSLTADRMGHLFRLAGCSETEARIMRSVSALEGGFDAINTYDTGFVSIGFIQFASLKDGAGSLGAMLLSYKLARPLNFATDLHRFGIEVTPEGVLDVLDPATGGEVTGPDANQKLIDDKRLVAVFQRAGQRSDEFQAAQIRCAKTSYYPVDDLLLLNLSGNPVSVKVGDIIKSEAGLATLMDRKVNTGKIDLLTTVLNKMASDKGITSPDGFLPFERDIVVALKYRRDYLADTTLSQPNGMPPKSGELTRRASGHGAGSHGQ